MASGDRSPEETNLTSEESDIELVPTFSYSLDYRILENCVILAILEPNGPEVLVAVSVTNKIVIKDAETSLNVTETIRCISSVPSGNDYDYILIGTDSHVICYDVHNNQTIFRNEVPDGVNCFAFGKLADQPEAIYCGGNCCVWGFDLTGQNIYWTVTGDVVITMCLCDYDGDGEVELIVGSPDYEIRVFKNDLMRAELMETDAITSLEPVRSGYFAYSLANGTIGTYLVKERQWRIKSKTSVSKIFNFENDNLLAVVWKIGKVDIRYSLNGDVICKTMINTNVASAACSKRARTIMDASIIVVCTDGRVKGFKLQRGGSGVSRTQQTIREYGQKKHNLMMELANYEQEEQMTDTEKERELRVPADTSCSSTFLQNTESRLLNVQIDSSNNVPIRGVLIFAEGLFDGESYIWIPPADKQNDCSVSLPLVVEKDMANDLHIKTLLGHVDSNKLIVYEMTLMLPKFCRFKAIPVDSDVPFVMPNCYVDVELNGKYKMADWFSDSFFCADTHILQTTEYPEAELKFIGLKPREELPIFIKISQSERKMRIYHDSIDTMGALVQSFCEVFNIQHLESHAIFPQVFQEVDRILSDLDPMTEVRDRLNAELQESQAIVKETLIRAEDAISIENMNEARKFYIRLKGMDAAARQASILRWNNQERCIKTLRRLNKIIENFARLRVGEPGRQIVIACRAAIADENKQIITKIMEFGASK